MKKNFLFKITAICIALITVLTSCNISGGGSGNNSDYDFYTRNGGEHLHILAGSEQEELEPILEEYARRNNQTISVDYIGSLDMMRMLQTGEMEEVDGLWPASSIWLSMGDDHSLLKHEASTSQTPVVFGVKQSLAEELGYKDNDDVTVRDIIADIEAGRLNFAMTNATQSNSGASAYLGFLTALDPSPEDGLTNEDLHAPELQEDITSLLAGVNRASGSSNWLRELFVNSGGQYDAMVNYEQLIIQTNLDLQRAGEETLYAVYPKDGLTISDSPLAYVDNGNNDKEDAFIELQEYLLSDDTQSEIEKIGKRSVYGTVREENQELYRADWGILPERTLVPIRFPQASVIQESLTLYQTAFKKPSLTAYVLDYSGSMYGEGEEQLDEALQMVLIPENAADALLLGTPDDITYLVPFSSETMDISVAAGNADRLNELYDQSTTYHASGGTSAYQAVIDAYNRIIEDLGNDLSNYSVSIIVLTDGMANDSQNFDSFERLYEENGIDVPVFSILFGDSSETQMERLAELTNARVFDGRDDLVAAFRQAKGYN